MLQIELWHLAIYKSIIFMCFLSRLSYLSVVKIVGFFKEKAQQL